MATAVRVLAGPWRFEELPGRDDLPDGCRYEVVDGHLVVASPPAQRHQLATAVLHGQLVLGCPPGWLVVAELGLPLGSDGRVPTSQLSGRQLPRAAGRTRAGLSTSGWWSR